jgi:hypothetical protein
VLENGGHHPQYCDREPKPRMQMAPTTITPANKNNQV